MFPGIAECFFARQKSHLVENHWSRSLYKKLLIRQRDQTLLSVIGIIKYHIALKYVMFLWIKNVSLTNSKERQRLLKIILSGNWTSIDTGFEFWLHLLGSLGQLVNAFAPQSIK